ncbi:fumarylacetoacetate hydrolase family protein [Paracoccus pacificus]|uniref:Fumarylacetoacetate hydrolase family protein n=1 Tax=Paracoccus pacificus TaxID=1463598 RepID=A0ABW4R4Q2_9RHOB
MTMHEQMNLPSGGRFVGRVWRPGIGPALVTVRGDQVVDVTSAEAPTMRDLLEMDDPAGWLDAQTGEVIGTLADLQNAGQGADDLRLLSPADLQAIKASGVTFADSMVERVIEEQAAGNPDLAAGIRARIGAAIGDNLRGIVPGSERAAEVKAALQKEGLWSQYLEVGIGPDAEIFTKCQPMASVGWGAQVGLHPISRWNNPEPEIVLAVDSRGRILGATLGNDVNLRDVEGRSALLLGKAKDNNASAALGPFIRLFDDSYDLDDVRGAELTLRVEGADGFVMDGASSMSRISRDPADLVSQARGRHHQYPDGFMLYLGTLFAPTQDRGAAGQGFTHQADDLVTIHEPNIGTLANRVALSTECHEWTFGAGALMRNLAGRGLL